MSRESKIPARFAQRGVSIVTAIFLIVVLALLGVYIVSVSGLQQSGSQLDVQGVRAYQAARAGIEWGAFQVLDPGNASLGAPVACDSTLPIPMPTCPASPTHIGPGHANTLAGSLSSFTVTIECSELADTTEGNRRVKVYQIVATGCNQIAGGSCLTATPSTGYVERRITATLTKCRDSTATLPRCACGALQISIVQSAGLMPASSTAESLIAIAVLIGAERNSSSRDHCTRTVRPGIRIAMKAASNAASSAVLWP